MTEHVNQGEYNYGKKRTSETPSFYRLKLKLELRLAEAPPPPPLFRRVEERVRAHNQTKARDFETHPRSFPIANYLHSCSHLQLQSCPSLDPEMELSEWRDMARQRWCPPFVSGQRVVIEHLLYELLSQIFDYFPEYSDYRRSSLQQASLVNKAFRAVCYPTLFRSIRFAGYEDELHVGVAQVAALDNVHPFIK